MTAGEWLEPRRRRGLLRQKLHQEKTRRETQNTTAALWDDMKYLHRTRLTPEPDLAQIAPGAVTWDTPQQLKKHSALCTALLLTPATFALTWMAPAYAQATNAAPSGTVSSGAPSSGAPRGAPINLSLGKVLPLQPPPNFRFRVDEGADIVSAVADGGLLKITPQRVGRATLVVEAPGRSAQTYVIRVVAAAAPAPDAATPNAPAPNPTTPAPNTTPATVTPATAMPTDAAARVTPVTADASPSTPLPPAAPALPPLDSSASPGPDTAQISPILPTPPPAAMGVVPSVPTNDARARTLAARSGANRRVPRNAVPLTQGLARLFRYSTNILAVFFSDVQVMDARAVNARTVAITGLAPGISTLAIFTQRYPGDTIGQANVYQIAVNSGIAGSSPGVPPPGTLRDPVGAEAAIRAALNDPRIDVSVIQLPDGGLTARLTGVVRDTAEIEAARSTAALFVPQVVSSLYVDKEAPSLQLAQRPAQLPENLVQEQLRRLTGNETIQVMPFNNGLAVRAEVASNAEAEALFSLLPGLGRPVTPFVIVRGAETSAAPSYYNRPVLTGEDAEMTRLLQGITGVSTVSVSRTAKNALAVYGTVRNRAEYDLVRRYARILPQVPEGAGGSGADSLGSNFAAGGNRFPLGIQMFVRILDDSQAVVRRVIAETNIVEISRTAARALGVEVGTVQLISESITRGTPGTTVAGPNGTITTGGTPDIVQQQLGTELRQGVFTAGRGTGGFGNLDPLRLRLNALYSNGTARILSQPNLSATEGATSQITVGGSRPIPITSAAGGGAGSVQTSVEFRPFGIILTMRPTSPTTTPSFCKFALT